LEGSTHFFSANIEIFRGFFKFRLWCSLPPLIFRPKNNNLLNFYDSKSPLAIFLRFRFITRGFTSKGKKAFFLFFFTFLRQFSAFFADFWCFFKTFGKKTLFGAQFDKFSAGGKDTH